MLLDPKPSEVEAENTCSPFLKATTPAPHWPGLGLAEPSTKNKRAPCGGASRMAWTAVDGGGGVCFRFFVLMWTVWGYEILSVTVLMWYRLSQAVERVKTFHEETRNLLTIFVPVSALGGEMKPMNTRALSE